MAGVVLAHNYNQVSKSKRNRLTTAARKGRPIKCPWNLNKLLKIQQQKTGPRGVVGHYRIDATPK
jgi:hypothetical protein